ncbi:MAG: TfoX/Sxy family protein [Ilumatobacteraceae bacterium]
MPYEEDLADRIREIVAIESELTEQRMFGGLAFVVGGHLAVGASQSGSLLVRVDPGRSAALIAKSTAVPMVMGGRQMAGWLRIESSELATKRQLAKWVGRGVEYSRSLPAKNHAKKKRRLQRPPTRR